MLNRSSIEDTIQKFKSYLSIITTDKDIFYYKGGDTLSSERIFKHSIYLELYISLLDYSLEWIDDNSDELKETAPFTDKQLTNVIIRGTELIKSIIKLSLNQ
jgi:hypothetical protein